MIVQYCKILLIIFLIILPYTYSVFEECRLKLMRGDGTFVVLIIA